jgi:5'-nucleotidase
MTWVLLTNDDGIESPALLPFGRALSQHHEVRVVVPDRERSWIGKAITRFDPVEVACEQRRPGRHGGGSNSANGSPERRFGRSRRSTRRG